MTKAVSAAESVLLATTVAGCSLFEQEEPEPVETEIPGTPSEQADLVCGIDRADVETAIGLPVGRVEGELTGQGADAAGTCEIWPEDDGVVKGAMLFVRIHGLSTDEGKRRAAELRGEVDGVVEPDVRYEGVEGGVWFPDLGFEEGTPTSVGGTSVVVLPDHVVALTSAHSDRDRDAATDLLALSQQVAASHGLSAAEE